MAWMRTKVKIPKELGPEERQLIAQDIIDFIIERSSRGLDKNNKKFKKYTKQYADIKGVGTGEVDLVLSGDMMDELDLISHRSGEILIGYDRDSDINGKVEGNVKGTYGSDEPKKPRDFLGISEKDLEKILSEYIER
jgi:hypothetical protein